MLQIATGIIDGNKMPTYALFTIDQRFNYWLNGDYLMHSHNITEVDHDLIEFEDLIREIFKLEEHSKSTRCSVINNIQTNL